MKQIGIHDMVVTSVFSALIAVFSLISLPTPFGIPFTLQTFIIAVCGYVLGSVRGVSAVVVYIALGVVGLPVFSGFQGGFSALLGMTGGFIIGFIPFVVFCGIKSRCFPIRLLSGFAGLIICHFFGILWFSTYSENVAGAFLTASVPYLVKDAVSIVIAVPVSEKIRSVIQKFN